jgi:hypothetical protein
MPTGAALVNNLVNYLKTYSLFIGNVEISGCVYTLVSSYITYISTLKTEIVVFITYYSCFTFTRMVIMIIIITDDLDCACLSREITV